MSERRNPGLCRTFGPGLRFAPSGLQALSRGNYPPCHNAAVLPDGSTLFGIAEMKSRAAISSWGCFRHFCWTQPLEGRRCQHQSISGSDGSREGLNPSYVPRAVVSVSTWTQYLGPVLGPSTWTQYLDLST